MEITFISNSTIVYYYQYNCIKYVIDNIPNVNVNIYISGERNRNSLYFNRIIGKIDSRFNSLNVNALSEVNLVENKAYLNYKIVDDLTYSDWVIFLDSDSKRCECIDKTKFGFLRFKDVINYSYLQSVNEEPYTLITLEYKSNEDDIWLDVDKMNLKTEVGIYNNRDKALLNCSLLFVKFIIKYDRGSLSGLKESVEHVRSNSFIRIFLYYLKIIGRLVKRKINPQTYNWKIIVKDKQGSSQFIDQPSLSFWADPFPIKFKNKEYVFFEEMNWETNLGQISVIELGDQREVKSKKVIIQENFHMSYPNVFFYDDEYYMIPETSDNNKLSIYRCHNFPYEWKHEIDLFNNIKLVDATWAYYDDLYWLFANKIEEFENENNEKLYLYYSESLFSTNWKAHPSNPIIDDASCARSAGKIYSDNGKLFRPSQNCLKSYGGNVVVNEIIELNTKNYQEKKISEIYPDKGYSGMHTINSDGGVQVFDYLALE